MDNLLSGDGQGHSHELVFRYMSERLHTARADGWGPCAQFIILHDPNLVNTQFLQWTNHRAYLVVGGGMAGCFSALASLSSSSLKISFLELRASSPPGRPSGLEARSPSGWPAIECAPIIRARRDYVADGLRVWWHGPIVRPCCCGCACADTMSRSAGKSTDAKPNTSIGGAGRGGRVAIPRRPAVARRRRSPARRRRTTCGKSERIRAPRQPFEETPSRVFSTSRRRLPRRIDEAPEKFSVRAMSRDAHPPPGRCV